MVIEYQK